MNAKAPHRDPSVQAMFEPMYQVDIHKQKRQETSKLLRALNIVDGMTPTEITNFADSMNWGGESNIEILTSRIEEFAKKDPASFLKLQLDPAISIKGLAGRGLRFNVVSHDINKSTISWTKGDILIATFDKSSDKSIVEQFAEWLQSHDKGKTVKASLEKQVKEAVNTHHTGEDSGRFREFSTVLFTMQEQDAYRLN